MDLRRSLEAILLVIHLSVSAGFTVNGPKRPVIAVVGEDVTLPCWIAPGKPVNMEVRWFKSLWENLVYQHREADPRGDDLGSGYQGRAGLFPEQIAAGNVSLRLGSVTISDEGKYKCFVSSSTEDDEAVIDLEVAMTGVQPWIDLEGVSEDRVRLVCRSQGWYPRPRVCWLDGSRQELEGAAENPLEEPGGLWGVDSSVRVASGQTNKFSCLITNPVLNSKLQITVRIADEFFPRASPWMVAFWVCSALVLIAVVATILAVRRYQIRKGKELKAEQSEREKLLGKQDVQRLLRAEARDNLLRYFVTVTLDESTADPRLELSENRKRVKKRTTVKAVDPSKDTFTGRECVLGDAGCTSGKWYWEVNVEGNNQWVIGVARASVERKAFVALTPANGFWTILRLGVRFEINTAPHENIREQIPCGVGILLDYHERKVSFYSVDSVSLLHTFTLTADLTEPLYPFFYTWDQDVWLTIAPKETKFVPNVTQTAPLLLA